MMRHMLKSKIHRATVTEAVVDYEGSIGIDGALVQQAGLMPGEKVLEIEHGVISANKARADVVEPGEERTDVAAALDETVSVHREAGLSVTLDRDPEVGCVRMAPETLAMIVEGRTKKGDVLARLDPPVERGQDIGLKPDGLGQGQAHGEMQGRARR